MTDAPNLLNPEPPQPAETFFLDTAGRKWHLKITVGTVRQLKAEMGLDLFASSDGSLFQELGGDPVKFCELLWCLVKDKAVERYLVAQSEALKDNPQHPHRLTEELREDDIAEAEKDFWQHIDDTAFDAATYAFFEALIAFFREDKRGPLRLILQKMKKAEAARVARATGLAESTKLDQLMTKTVDLEFAAIEAKLDQSLAELEPTKPQPGGR